MTPSPTTTSAIQIKGAVLRARLALVEDYPFYYDQGRREHQAVGPREAVLTTHDAETFSVADCAAAVGWHRRALEMCGATSPRVVEEECRARGGKACRYRLSWS